MTTKEITFSNLSIELPEGLLNYSDYKNTFNKLALEKASIFSSNYHSKFKNMDDLAKNGFQYGLELIKPVIEVAVEELVKKGMYDINEEYFTEKFVSKYFLWENDFNHLLETYYEICLTEEEAKQYREDRKNNRSRWGVLATSGDFSKAVDAQLTTGMWNVAEGIGHSIFNAIGNAASKSVAKAEKKKLFFSNDTISNLSKGVYRTCFNIHFALIDALNINTNHKIFTREELIKAESQADRLLENLSKGRIPKEDKEKVIATIISTYPFGEKFYKHLINDGFNIKDVIKLGSYFSEDVLDIIFGESTSKIKRNIDFYNFEERSKIISKIKEIGKIDPDFDDNLNDFKKTVLTFNNNEFTSLEELGSVMKKEEENINKIVNYFEKYDSKNSIYTKNIPSNKEINAFLYYNIPDNEKIIVLIDDTVMGSAKQGIAFCKRGIYLKNSTEIKSIAYKDLSMIEDIKSSTFGVSLILSNKEKIEMDLSGSQFHKNDLFIIMNGIFEKFTGKKIIKNTVDDISITDKIEGKSTINNVTKNHAIKNISRKNYKIIWVIYFILFPILSSFFLAYDLIYMFFIISAIFSFFVAKEKGRSKVIWTLLGVIGIAPLFITILKHTPERIVELG